MGKSHLGCPSVEVRKKLGFQVGPEPDLSVSYFWYPAGNDENSFNKKLLQNIHEDGRVFFSSTLLNGRFVIRIAILSFRTKTKTIDLALDMIRECLEKTMNQNHGFQKKFSQIKKD